MDDRLIETIAVAQVLTLAKALKAEKEANGVRSDSNYIKDAVRLIQKEAHSVLQILSQAQQH